ncbi:zinc-dependent peptidase [Fontibacter flavus]|uniref:Zinc-dependent peptidase n=1 Tax=Fontibacter flavus TaxID=654838 RepID=A0ABV6FVD1_9BACT
MLFIFHLIQSLQALFSEIRMLLFFKKLSIEDVSVLKKFFPYYRNLSDDHQREFIERLRYILVSKTFVPRGGLKEITREMELLISATAVMVTFGFRQVKLSHFSKILVYPDDYYSTINKKYHRGEVNPKLGIIVLSWKSFVDGFLQVNDGVNLGIHEMAHALKLENQIHYNQESNFFNPQRWKVFAKFAHEEILKIKSGKVSFFRESAAIDSHEFFAVALESFFEKPSDFKNYHPELYQALVFLLKQDPIVLSGKGK